MAYENIVRNQRVTAQKVERSKQLRQAMTPEEAMLWRELRSKCPGDLRFRRQQIIDGFIVDFYCHQAGVVIEIDGEIHQQQRAYDEARDEILSGHGLRIMRFTNAEVRDNLPQVVATIYKICEAALAGPHPPAPSP